MRVRNYLQVRHTAERVYSTSSEKRTADNPLEYFRLPNFLTQRHDRGRRQRW